MDNYYPEGEDKRRFMAISIVINEDWNLYEESAVLQYWFKGETYINVSTGLKYYEKHIYIRIFSFYFL